MRVRILSNARRTGLERRTRTSMLLRLILCAMSIYVGVLITACSRNEHISRQAPPSTAPSRVAAFASSPALSNGESIFQTGRDLRGTQIVAMPPPIFTSCAACHRSDGAGGMHLPGGATSADLRHSALVSGQRVPYTLTLIERAISSGVNNQGHYLNPIMPRWRLTTQDLHDVASYVLNGLSQKHSN
jgi:mono/diheme cytochrome c family protein